MGINHLHGSVCGLYSNTDTRQVTGPVQWHIGMDTNVVLKESSKLYLTSQLPAVLSVREKNI